MPRGQPAEADRRSIVMVGAYAESPSHPIRGPQQVVRGLSRAFAGAGRTVRVLSSPYNGMPLRPQRRRDGDVQVVVVNPLSLFFLSLKKHRAIFHISSFSVFHAGALLARRALRLFLNTGLVVYTVHGLIVLESQLGYRSIPALANAVERYLVTRSDVVVAVSSEIADEVIRWYDVPRSKVSVIGNGGADHFYRVFDQPGKFDRQPPTLLFPGGLRHVKGIDFLASAAMRLHTLDPDRPWQIGLAGETYPSWNKPEHFDALVETGRFWPMGLLPPDELATAFRTSLAVVLPSRYEPFGNVVVEAMAAGTVPIISDRVGCRDLLQSGVSGLIVTFGDEVGLTAAMKSVLDDPKAAREMGEKAREVALENTWPSIAAQYLDLYQDAMG